MQDSVAYESYPTHPLGARDSWPITGPIYGIPEMDAKPEPSRTIWQRLVTNSVTETEEADSLPANPPIWY